MSEQRKWVHLKLSRGGVKNNITYFLTLNGTSSSFPHTMATVVDHIVLLKVRPDATDEEIKRLFDGTANLKAIPGVITITIGATFVEPWMGDRRGGYTHALSCRLESKEALKLYQDHELHTKFKMDCIVPILEGPLLAVDYESVVVVAGDSK